MSRVVHHIHSKAMPWAVHPLPSKTMPCVVHGSLLVQWLQDMEAYSLTSPALSGLRLESPLPSTKAGERRCPSARFTLESVVRWSWLSVPGWSAGGALCSMPWYCCSQIGCRGLQHVVRSCCRDTIFVVCLCDSTAQQEESSNACDSNLIRKRSFNLLWVGGVSEATREGSPKNMTVQGSWKNGTPQPLWNKWPVTPASWQ